MNPPGWKVSNMLLGKSGGQLLIAPERMDQSTNDAQLWMYLVVMKVKFDAIKNNIAYIGTWNVRSMNQGKLDIVKEEMPRVNNY